MAQRDHQADHVLRAYRYQLLHALQEWIDLQPGQELLLEIDEDHAVLSDDRADNTQVKFSDSAAGPRALSLRSPGIVQAIERYWHQSQEGKDARPYLRVLTNSTAAREQAANFPGGQPGLVYWKEAARGSDLKPLRTLLGQIFAGTPLGAWLQSNPPDNEIRSRLLSRVEFVLAAPDDVVLQAHIRERLGMLYLSKGHFETTADIALPALLDRVFVAASSKDVNARRLSVGDLHRAIEESLPRMGVLGQQGQRPETGIGVTPMQIRVGVTDRSETVTNLMQHVAQEDVIWLYGPNGVGKSTLAKLIAKAHGGSWLICDFRPFAADPDGRGAVAVWRELMSTLAAAPPPDGIIFDDISAHGVDLIKSRLAGLAAATKIRGAKIVITSNHTPSSALLTEIGSRPLAALEAPYFKVSEVRELVEQNPSPKAELVDAWAHLIHVSTSGGHPLLVTAKIANLRARGWPDDALLEDLGSQINEGVKGTRAEARKRLLAELPATTSARAVLERVSTVFQTFDDGLVRALCGDPPRVEHPSDALTLLKGSWLEPIGGGDDWRLSPLLSDLGADVPMELAQRWRQIAAEYWISKGPLDARTLPLCFWNAYWGRHLAVLMAVIHAVMRLETGQLQSAAAMLSPLAAFRTDRPLLAENPLISCGLRLLQVVVADAVEDEKTAIAASQILLDEIDAASPPEFRDLQTSISAKVVLGLDRVWIPARTQVAYLRRLKATLDRVMAGSFPDLAESMRTLTEGLPKGADACGMLLGSVFVRINDSEHLSEMIDAVAELGEDERSELLLSAHAVVQDLGLFVHKAWAHEQLDGKDLQRALGFYEHMRSVVSGWKMPELEAQFAIAQSVILDEGLNDRQRSLDVIEAAIEKFGNRPVLIRQKSKVLKHEGLDDAAASLLIEIEDSITELTPFDQGLALRDGAEAAAAAKRYDDALRLFRKAETAFASSGDSGALRIGLIVDEAIVLWELGQREAAIRCAGDALEAVEKIDSSSSRQNLRAHQMARAVVGLFMVLVAPYLRGPKPAVRAGMGSILEGSSSPEAVDLKPLADNWRILEAVEIEVGVDADIARRSAARQGASRVVSLESSLANAHFAKALHDADVDGAVRAVVPAVSLLKKFKSTLGTGQDGPTAPLRADIGELLPLSIADLLATGWLEAIQGALVDIMLTLTLAGSWAPDGARQLQHSVVARWGSDELLQPLLQAATGKIPAVGSNSMPILVASSLGTVNDDATLSLEDRIRRDLFWIYQVANSLGRHTLEPLVVKALATGWRFVIEHQSFALTMPMRTTPTIEAAIKALEQDGIRSAPFLLEVAAEAARVAIPPQWKPFLVVLRGDKN